MGFSSGKAVASKNLRFKVPTVGIKSNRTYFLYLNGLSEKSQYQHFKTKHFKTALLLYWLMNLLRNLKLGNVIMNLLIIQLAKRFRFQNTKMWFPCICLCIYRVLNWVITVLLPSNSCCLFHRGYYNHTRRCTLGGCMVAGLSHSRPHYTHVSCAFVVHAQVSPCIRGSNVQVLSWAD